jgi:argininosuccinate lyase
VKGGVPFREAHEQVAASVRDESYTARTTAAESVAARRAPGPGGVVEAIATARKRFGASR